MCTHRDYTTNLVLRHLLHPILFGDHTTRDPVNDQDLARSHAAIHHAPSPHGSSNSDFQESVTICGLSMITALLASMGVELGSHRDAFDVDITAHLNILLRKYPELPSLPRFALYRSAVFIAPEHRHRKK